MSAQSIMELCEDGLAAESVGRIDDARAAYAQAWESADDAFERSLAAHYSARVSPNDASRVAWARRSVDLAIEALDAGDERIAPLIPTMRITTAAALMAAGLLDEAIAEYLGAAEGLRVVGESDQRDVLQAMIYDGLNEAGYVSDVSSRPEVATLLAALKRDDVDWALRLVLADLMAGYGTDGHAAEFALALHRLRGLGRLSADHLAALDAAIEALHAAIPASGSTGRGARADASESSAGVNAGVQEAQASSAISGDDPNVALRL
ncbi:hypothetical protein [Gordonia sputi]|uniref:hypothetical protein n=1 Tax=Gordonia sputi TaxID=36823 RepID=UPI0020430637|nr:hypothetical protein [Gordonia sputi]MCM3898041.1 hypothetical protein [Gordonia sputi]